MWGVHVPLHFTRVFASYKLTRLPPNSIDTLERFREIARGAGL